MMGDALDLTIDLQAILEKTLDEKYKKELTIEPIIARLQTSYMWLHIRTIKEAWWKERLKRVLPDYDWLLLTMPKSKEEKKLSPEVRPRSTLHRHDWLFLTGIAMFIGFAIFLVCALWGPPIYDWLNAHPSMWLLWIGIVGFVLIIISLIDEWAYKRRHHR